MALWSSSDQAKKEEKEEEEAESHKKATTPTTTTNYNFKIISTHYPAPAKNSHKHISAFLL